MGLSIRDRNCSIHIPEDIMSKATDDAMDKLHGDLAEELSTAIKKRTEDGMPIAALLSVARQFLKDNHIECGPGVASKPLGELAGLPEFDEDGTVVPLKRNMG